MIELKAGDVLHVTAACSVQFAKPIIFRLIKARHDLITYQGWIWLDGYELDAQGDAVARREIYVLRAGLTVQRPTAPAQSRRGERGGPSGATGQRRRVGPTAAITTATRVSAAPSSVVAPGCEAAVGSTTSRATAPTT
jgi:hypothetical protein